MTGAIEESGILSISDAVTTAVPTISASTAARKYPQNTLNIKAHSPLAKYVNAAIREYAPL